MVQIPGKYKLVENKNFYEFLVGVGIPEEKAKADDKNRGTLEISVDGGKIAMSNDTPKYTTNLVVGKEVNEEMSDGFVLLSTAKLEGNVITVTSNLKDGGSAGSRTFTFTDSGMEVVITAARDGKTYTATRIYKRV